MEEARNLKKAHIMKYGGIYNSVSMSEYNESMVLGEEKNKITNIAAT